jgi:hypothetical protein
MELLEKDCSKLLVCSDHFEDTMFVDPNNRERSKRLPNSYPTLMKHLSGFRCPSTTLPTYLSNASSSFSTMTGFLHAATSSCSVTTASTFGGHQSSYTPCFVRASTPNCSVTTASTFGGPQSSYTPCFVRASTPNCSVTTVRKRKVGHLLWLKIFSVTRGVARSGWRPLPLIF